MQAQTTRYALYGVISGVAVLGLIGLIVVMMPNINEEPPISPNDGPLTDIPQILFESTQELKKFSSSDQLRTFLLQVAQRQRLAYEESVVASSGGPALPLPLFDRAQETAAPSLEKPLQAQLSDTAGDSGMIDFSSTNVQVHGVDEPDFLKNDGKYVYILSNDKLTIVEAFPAENAKVILKVGLDVQGQSLQNMFLNKDRLVIFYQGQGERYLIDEYDYRPSPIYSPTTHALILDISDKENAKIVKDYEISGYYQNARMIGDHVYFIANNGVDYRNPIIPYVTESSRSMITPDVYYFDNPEEYYNFNTITAINVFGGQINADTFMIGQASTIYVSEDSIYITYTKSLPYPYYKTNTKDRFFKVIIPLLPGDVQAEIKTIENSNLDEHEKWSKISDLLQETYNRMSEKEKERLFNNIQKEVEEYETRLIRDTQVTVIHKIGMDRLILTYSSKAEVPGRLLNQFSMDEFDGKFRIATTSESFGSQSTSVYNNVYVLDQKLDIVGSLEKIAPRETIYSARFMGDRLYLVTFERIDPFFVIDLSTDTPKILGELKMPGYSNYLHPYDEKHVIGIGKETKENQWGGVEVLGVKVALFDVSNVSNPRVVDVFTIGDQSTDSEVLWNHKALLFDKNKNVLSIPIQSNIYADPLMKDIPVEPKFWRGFYVFGVDPISGFTLKGKVEHPNNYYDYGYGSRSFYIGDVLYTVTGNLMKMNDLSDMHEINQVKLGNTGEIIKYID